MVKSATQWLRGLVRVGKVQRRGAAKLAKTLFGAPVAKPKPRAKAKPKAAPKARPAPKLALKLKVTVSKPAARPVVPRAAVVPEAPPGKWLAAHYSPAPEMLGLSGKRMSYWLYLPAREPSATVRRKGWPLVVMLHGCDQTATQFAQGTRMNLLAEKKGFAVLYPQQSLRSHPHRCWKWYDKATQAGGGDVRMIVGAIEQVLQKYALDRGRVYLGGMSAGAGMANIVALRHPQLIAALGLHSGPVFGAGHGMIGALGVMQHGAGQRVDGAIDEVLAHSPAFPQLPTILIQGREDKVVRPINQVQLTRQGVLLNRMPRGTALSVAAKAAGRGGNAHQVHDYTVGKDVLLRVALIERLEHAWSGGDPALAFNAKAGPDASKMMFEFFAGHRRLE
ncbi:MAG TPA: PHB depolymerase esterase [Janthinobacterium sp.]|nr:PHB depolymerase esterase [Janthinobacterium sp.]